MSNNSTYKREPIKQYIEYDDNKYVSSRPERESINSKVFNQNFCQQLHLAFPCKSRAAISYCCLIQINTINLFSVFTKVSAALCTYLLVLNKAPSNLVTFLYTLLQLNLRSFIRQLISPTHHLSLIYLIHYHFS